MQWLVQASRPAGYVAVLASLSETLYSCEGCACATRAVDKSPSSSHAQACKAGERLVHLPAHCQLTYGVHTTPDLMRLIEKVPQEFWGAKLALQVLLTYNFSTKRMYELYGVHMSAAKHFHGPSISGRGHGDHSFVTVDPAREDAWDCKLLQALHQQSARCSAGYSALLHPGGRQGSGGIPATQVCSCMQTQCLSWKEL